MRKTHTKSQILTALKYLKQCGSVQETAKMWKVSRNTIYAWREQYAEEFKKNQYSISQQALTTEAQKLVLNSNTNELAEKTINLFNNIIEYFMDDFDEKFAKLSGRDKINLLNTLLPYVLEKKGVLPPPGNGEGGLSNNTQNNYFMNIIQQMKDGDSEDNIRRNIKAIAVSPDS